MGTLADLKARILDEIGGEVSVRQIGAAIKRAIDHYAAERFWFNVERGTTVTVAGVDTAALPPRLRREDAAYVTLGSRLTPLCKRTFSEIDEAGDLISQGQPTDYAMTSAGIRLYPTPNAIFTLTLPGVYDAAALSADSSSNAWTTEAVDLIAAAAKKLLLRDIKGDAAGAAIATGAEADALYRLRAETAQRLNTGRMRASA